MKECNLSGSCEHATTCKAPCQAFIAVHGMNNKGGKQGDALIPVEFRQTTFETSKCRNDQANLYRNLEKYIGTFKKAFLPERNTKETRLKDWFFYSREKGVGKTETASMLANEFITYAYLRSIYNDEPSAFNCPVFYLDMPALQTLYLKANRGNTPKDIAEEASREYYRRLGKAKTHRFVVFDEMAIRDASDAFRTDIHDVINHRTNCDLTSIYTSNVPLKEMADLYDERIYDRIRKYTIEHNFVGESKRGLM